MAKLEAIIYAIDNFAWGPVLIALCIICGVVYTIGLKFPQLRLFKESCRCAASGNSKDAGISPLQSVMIVVGGRVGTGNITGTASAICYGGPGAVFWMWMMAIVCGILSYVEAALAQVWKKKKGDEYVGGPSFYMEDGLKHKGLGKFLAMFYAVGTIIFLIVLTALQSNSFSGSAQIAWHLDPKVTAVVYAALVAVVVFGGVKRIAKIAEKFVPVMSILYLIAALVALVFNLTKIPQMFGLIFSCALSRKSVLGGMLGTAISWGIKRGVFSNETGLGSGAWASGAVGTSHPAKIGLAQVTSVYIDTLLICSATAFMILGTGCYDVYDNAGNALIQNIGSSSYETYASLALNTIVPGIGAGFIALAMLFFTFSTVMAYSVYLVGVNGYLFRRDETGRNARRLEIAFNAFITAFAFIGPLVSAGLAFSLASAICGVLYMVNLAVLLVLYKPATSILKDYEAQKVSGLDPIFIPENCGIDNAPEWHEILQRDYQEELRVYREKNPAVSAFVPVPPSGGTGQEKPAAGK